MYEADAMHQVGPGQALFRFVRHWSRRSIAAGQGVDPDRGRDVMVTEAVAALAGPGAAVTVNDVAEELGLDQSGASRLITQAVRRGYLRKVSSLGDARLRLIEVTDMGSALLDSAHEWQEQVFAQLTSSWDPAEVQQFHRMMSSLIHPRA